MRLSARPSVCLKPKYGRLKTKFDDDAENAWEGSGPTFHVFYQLQKTWNVGPNLVFLVSDRRTDGRTDAINIFWVFLVKYYSKFGITLIDGLQQRISEFYYQENHSLAYIVDVKQEKNTFCGRTDIILLK